MTMTCRQQSIKITWLSRNCGGESLVDPPRRYRKFNNTRKRHFTKFRGQRRYAAFLPQNAFAGGKGPQKFSSSVQGRNPRGKDGKPLKCSICSSAEHLWRKCPNNPSGQPPPMSGTNYGGAGASGSSSSKALFGGLSLFANSREPSIASGKTEYENIYYKNDNGNESALQVASASALPGMAFTGFSAVSMRVSPQELRVSSRALPKQALFSLQFRGTSPT